MKRKKAEGGMNLVFSDGQGDTPVMAPAFTHLLDQNLIESTREIFISGEIDEDFSHWFTMAMRRLESQGESPITIWLNTPG